jgi:hypothetical protein
MITINNTQELLTFIKRDDVTAKQAAEIICKTLKVLVLFEMTKKELIESTEYCINTFYNNSNSERPIFLCQKTIDFDIKDAFP